MTLKSIGQLTTIGHSVQIQCCVWFLQPPSLHNNFFWQKLHCLATLQAVFHFSLACFADVAFCKLCCLTTVDAEEIDVTCHCFHKALVPGDSLVTSVSCMCQHLCSLLNIW